MLDTFAALLHEALPILGPLPLDYEIHDGPGVPLHAHVSARYYPYSNIGGTLNLPSNLTLTVRPPRRWAASCRLCKRLTSARPSHRSAGGSGAVEAR